jgi:hypothetical protein
LVSAALDQATTPGTRKNDAARACVPKGGWWSSRVASPKELPLRTSLFIAIANMPPTDFPRSSIARLAWIALAAANAVSAADLIEIAWSPNGRFERTVSVAAGRFAEICGKLDQGDKVAWRFVAEPAMAFNVHYHVGKDVVYPAKRESETQLTGNLVAPVTQDYCWMWSNKTTREGRVTATLER